MVQSGDFSSGNGKGGESIYNGFFEDESFEMKHTSPFLLSMANKGPNTNGSQFFITTAEAPHLDGVHVVFGQVISGKEVIQEIEQLVELWVSEEAGKSAEARLVSYGSYKLSVVDCESDLDLLCVVPSQVTRTSFFTTFYHALQNKVGSRS